jgi:endonuclease/exonuclease/phosphatase family metal-dependent hydrolase
MLISVGTFNLNNLFSRFNFEAEISSLDELKNGITFDTHSAGKEGAVYNVRNYQGKLVTKKDPKATEIIAERIKRMDIDVLAVQEVEDKDTLKEFNTTHLQNKYSFVGVIDGNDPRLIDVGILSKFPIGGLTSWQYTVHPDIPQQPVFSRDVLEIEILSPKRDKKLFTLYNNHLKSHFIDFREDPKQAEKKNNACRKRQAESLAQIIQQQTNPNSNYIITGDMNDPVNSPYLFPFTKNPELGLINALTNPQETHPFKEKAGTTAWTHRFKPSGKPAQYELYDQIWLSKSLATKEQAAFVDRRIQAGGDGSDHDPVWVILKLD